MIFPLRLLRVVLSGMIAASVLASAPASADPSKEDVAKADALFRDAQKAIEAGQLSEGCAKFAESQRLDPANGTLLNLALCHEKEGKAATAYVELGELLAVLGKSKTADDRERSKVATEHKKGLEKRLSRATFDVTALPKEASLTLDGEKVGDPTLPALIDPGKHSVEATAPGKKPRVVAFEVTEPGTQTVKIEPLEDEVVAPAPVPTESPKPRAQVTSDGVPVQKIIGAVVAGVGLVGVGVGSYFGLDTFYQRDQRDRHCNDTTCDAEGIRFHEDAQTSATISTVAIGLGALAIGVGAFLFFTAKPSRAASMGIGPGGLVVRGDL